MRRAALVALVLSVALVAPASAVHQTGSKFRVGLAAGGDADVLLKESFDLNESDERRRFEQLADDQATREKRLSAFRSRLRNAAASAAEATGRPMSISSATISTTRYDNGTGVVRLRAAWSNLAAVEDDRLVVTAPFGRSLSVNRSLVVVAPAGFTRMPGRTTPPPKRARKRTGTWGHTQDLSGFKATFEGPTARPKSTTPTATPAPSGIGVFVGASALAVLPAAALALALWDRRGT